MFISSLKRVKTVGDNTKFIDVPGNHDFFSLVEEYGKQFHTLIHAINQSRFLGNCSFRCEKGFASFKQNNIVFMSKRNLDKRNISKDSFVPVLVKSDMQNGIMYYGEHKPSVDTPIQIKLYQTFTNINYIIHSHVYIQNAPYTKHKIPCGAIEEAEEIKALFNDYSQPFYAINLIGHGSLIMSNDVKKLKDITFIKREVLEK